MTTAASPLEARQEALQKMLRGQVTGPSDPGYDVARRIWNGAVDRRPALIVKRRYDPDNLFRSNHNIAPEADRAAAQRQPPGPNRDHATSWRS